MLKLRGFEPSDAEIIVQWIGCEREFRMWCADQYDHFPIKAEDMVTMYEKRGKTGTFFPMTVVDENDDAAGHLILRYADEFREVVRFGFIIIDDSLRGRGIGREMLRLAKEYAVSVLGAKWLTLGVFANNLSALKCYRSVGFHEAGREVEEFEIFDEKWKCIEMLYDVSEQTTKCEGDKSNS
jgi:RimJ/RimL family protein N-acetyltransferase